MGDQIEWPWALAYRLALRLGIENISKTYVEPIPLHLSIPTTRDVDEVRRSLCTALSAKLSVGMDETVHNVDVVDVVQERIRRSSKATVCYYILSIERDVKVVASAVPDLLCTWEELMRPIRGTVQFYLLVVLECTKAKIWRRFAAPCREALEKAGLKDRILPDLSSPTEENVISWLNDCVHGFYGDRAHGIRDDVVAPFRRRRKIPHQELKAQLVPILERLST
jgi:hypothetical protein